MSTSLPWYEVKAVGKPVGGGLQLVGIAGAAFGLGGLLGWVTVPPALKLLLPLLSPIAIYFGHKLFRKKYMLDPVAVAEYRAEFHQGRLSAFLANFEWEQILFSKVDSPWP